MLIIDNKRVSMAFSIRLIFSQMRMIRRKITVIMNQLFGVPIRPNEERYN